MTGPLSLLFEEAPSARGAEGQDEDRSFAPDLNLDQIVAAIAGDREERDLITTVLYGHLRDADAVHYRQEVLAVREYLVSYLASAEFTALVSDTGDRKGALGGIRYCTRIKGGRVEVGRYQDEADHSAAVLKTFERFKQGAAKDYRVRYRISPGMNHVTAQILELVARLFPEKFTALDEYCRRHAAFLDEDIRRIDRELQFYLAYLDHIRPLRVAGLRFGYPEVSARSKDVLAAGAYDLALDKKLVSERKPVVTNDFRLEGRERIFVVTGPNQGGKTTFALTFGQLHHLASVGCPVPGSAARLFLFDRLFTHFEREEDLAKMSGKLEDDLVRIGEIVRVATPDSIVVRNEIFTSTTPSWTSWRRSGGNPAERTYKVVRKPADGLAYALAIAEKYDLTYERLRGRVVP